MNDDELRVLVKDSLADRAERLPAATPPWDRLRAGLVDVRRERHRRQAFAALAVAVLVAVGVVRLDAVGGRRAEPALPDGPLRASAVFGGRTVGSLATDKPFLDAVRRAFVAAKDADYYGSRLPAGATATDVLVPFAGDVGDVRLVLLEVVLLQDAGLVDQFLWFQAPRGAGPAAILAAGPPSMEASDGETSYWAAAGGADQGEGPGTGAFVLLSTADGGDLQLATGPTYAADGRTSWTKRTVPKTSAQHWEVPVPWAYPLAPATWYRHSASSWSRLDLPAPATLGRTLLADTLPAVHGTPAPPAGLAQFALLDAQGASGVAAADSTRRLLWSGRAGTTKVVVVAVTVPGGAHVVSMDAERVNGAGTITGGPTRVVPAGPLEDLALAWVPGDQSPDLLPQEIYLLGPVGAVTAVVTDDSGPHTVRLDDAFGRVTVLRPTTVVFTDAAGRTVATPSVPEQEQAVTPPDTP